jgi:hypothetical protein
VTKNPSFDKTPDDIKPYTPPALTLLDRESLERAAESGDRHGALFLEAMNSLRRKATI